MTSSPGSERSSRAEGFTSVEASPWSKSTRYILEHTNQAPNLGDLLGVFPTEFFDRDLLATLARLLPAQEEFFKIEPSRHVSFLLNLGVYSERRVLRRFG